MRSEASGIPRAVTAAGAVAAILLAACSSSNGNAPTSSRATPTPTTAPGSNSGSAAALQGAYVAVVKKVLPSVVQIETSSGLGSGIVYDSKGDIVTNNHVVSDATSFTVTTSNAKKYQGTLVGSFPADDLAVIHVSNATLTPASFADSSKLEVGDIVMAIGNPLGLQSSVTAGIVSATGRTVSEDNGVVLPDTIQTSAEINPGNSGGALVDLNGSVVGIPTLAAIDQQLGGSAPGIGFAIPSDIVTSIASQLINTGHVTHSGRAYLGVRIVVAAFGSSGALIASVDSGSPAAAAGLQAGDTITAINGKSVASPDDLSQLLAELAPGDKAQVTLVGADGTQRTATVTLGEIPG